MSREGQPSPVLLENYAPPDFLVDALRLHINIEEDRTQITSRIQIRRNPNATSSQVPEIGLNGVELELLAVRVNGVALDSGDYRLNDDFLYLPISGDKAIIEVENLVYPHKNTSLEGLYRSQGAFCTQCEAQGFRKITYFLDRPDVMTKYLTTIVADAKKYPVMLSNGNFLKSQLREDGKSEVTWEDPFPKPSYLFALVVGDLECVEDHFETKSGREVLLRMFVEEHNVDKCEHALESLKKAMRWDEVVFGLEYDLDLYMIVAIDDFNMGAMENKGLNVFNSKYVLAKPEIATDSDYVTIESIVAHEYFHNWTGNRVTCRDWFQLTLKEGLTVFRDQQFTADMTSQPVKRIDDVDILRSRQFPEDAGPMAHPIQPQSYVEINNFYTVTVYNKGAEVIRMMHCLADRKGFRRGMDLYFASHDGQAVTVFDFLRAIEEGSGTYLKKFKHWYQQAGTPVLSVRNEYEPEQQCFSITFSQTCPATPGQPEKEPFPIPIKVGLLDANGEDLSLRFEGEKEYRGTNVTILLDTRERTVRFAGILAKPVASVLREFSAPVKLDYPREDSELAFLMAHDTDEFNRWDAGQTLALRLILRAVEANDGDFLGDDLFADAFLSILNDTDLDPALAARALMLPTEDYISQQSKPIRVSLINEMRLCLKQRLALTHSNRLLEVYQAQRELITGNGSDFMGPRSLKNTCLDYLMSLRTDDAVELTLDQFDTARNMTDQGAALRLLADSNTMPGRQALLSFYEQWKDEPLAMDKWFSYQAMVPQMDTIKTVKKLRAHELFDLGNPNRVRSLIGTFAERNPIGFHNIDGSGYSFLADNVLELNAMNPQLAARLIAPLTLWHHHTSQRQDLMIQQLDRIAGHKNLVRNIFELVDKSLQERRK